MQYASAYMLKMCVQFKMNKNSYEILFHFMIIIFFFSLNSSSVYKMKVILLLWLLKLSWKNTQK